MKIWEAAVKVLQERGEALSVREIYDCIISNGLYYFKAQHPIHVLNSEIRGRCENITFPSAYKDKYFVRLDNGTYNLISSFESTRLQSSGLLYEEKEHFILEKKLDVAYNAYRESFKKLLLEEVKIFSPEEFELFSRNLLRAYGFVDVCVTAKGKDGGIDGYGKLRSGLGYLNAAFQCKRWTKAYVGRREIDMFRGAISGIYDQGIFFTTSQFSKDSVAASSRQGAVPIILVDGESLVETMLAKEIGVTVKNCPRYVVSLDEMLLDND